MIKLTDSHTHLFREYFDDIDKVLDNARLNHVERVIVNADNLKTSIEVLELINKPFVYGAIGIHPEYADSYTLGDLKFIENNLDKEKIVAIGEIGLDYHFDYDKEKQIKLFRYQLDLAEKHHLPVIIHARDSLEDVINILKDYHVKGVVHSFEGSIDDAKKLKKLGFCFGINGIVTFKNSNLKDVVRKILYDIVLETDSPYLAPVPYRGMKNDSSKILDIAKFISSDNNISLEMLSQITEENVKKIFDI